MLADVQLETVDGMPVARVHGEVDMSNATDVAQALRRAVDQVSAGLVLDFSRTDYLDSAGLHFVFDLAKRLRDRGQRLLLVVPPESSVAPLLDIVRVDVLAPRHPTLEAAVEALRAHADDVPLPPPA